MARPKQQQSRAGMADTTITATGLRIAKLLVGKPPQTVAELIRQTGVTRTAVTEQLNELISAGFVQRTVERLPGRGRPRYLFRATDAALMLLFANNQRLVVPAIWKAIEDVGGPELTEKVLQQVSRTVAQHYKTQITARSPKKRLRRMCELLQDEGNLVEMDRGEDGELLLVKRSCAFFSMFDPGRMVCAVDLSVMREVVGAPIRRTECRHDGAPCCTFELVPNGEA
jgi:predicted ArsR family transcriptional regulator